MSGAPRAAPGAHALPHTEGHDAHGGPQPSGRALAALSFTALGVVYGDIGTSPLYALRACFGEQGVPPTADNVHGVLSLVFWSLILVISVWYLSFILQADNRGEGGILALLALATSTSKGGSRRAATIALGLVGAALIYGDGMITPAISVLGAMEGLEEATPALRPLVIPLTLVVLIALFLVQKRGTARVARLFAPITLLWFLLLGTLGARAISTEPRVLAAVNPLHALRFFAENGATGFLVLGFVFLVVTGGEALYADMGHIGKRPIRVAWFTLVLPALLLNYFGQGALLLADPLTAENPFFLMVPRPLIYPAVAIATAATVVASQAVISGAFSLTRQALQLGYVPRMKIVHTSESKAGQIYVPAVNAALLVGCVALVLGFRSADRLAAAYGIAVSATMPITTLLFVAVAISRMGWSVPRAVLLGGFFLCIDLAFFAANAVKVMDGGWFPLTVAAAVYLVMTTWHRGGTLLGTIGQRSTMPLEMLLESLERRNPTRVPGTAVFMSNVRPGDTPLVLLHHLKHNQVLHERVILLSILTEEVPVVPDGRRIEMADRGHGFYQVEARYGFMETPDVPEALARVESLPEGSLDLGRVTYYLGRQTLLPTSSSGMVRWRKKLFRFLSRNALRPTAYFGLPPNRVVELGAQVQF